MVYPPEKTPEQVAAYDQVLEAISKKVDEVVADMDKATYKLALEGGLSKWVVAHFVAVRFNKNIIEFDGKRMFDTNSNRGSLTYINMCIEESSRLMSLAYTVGHQVEPEGMDMFGGSSVREIQDWKDLIQQAQFRMAEVETHLTRAAKAFSKKHPEVEKED